MEKEGSKWVEIVAMDDKRQITAVFAGSLTGDFLPPQLIYNVLLNGVFQESMEKEESLSSILTTQHL